ncbi:MAG TPA: ATP-binding protein [Candidatus Paceibacterota bacterium]
MGLYTLITLVLIVTAVILTIKNRRLKARVRQAAHQFDETTLIVESLRDGLIECDTQMVPTRVNHAAETILGIEASQIVNRTIVKSDQTTEIDKKLGSILFAPKDSAESYDVLYGELKLRIFTVPKTDPHTKSLMGYIKIVRDVTIETVVEKHKNELVSIVSHQLLTPLTGIKWIMKSLLSGDTGAVNTEQSEMLRKGLSAANNMIGLVADILDVTKVEETNYPYKKLPHDVVSFVHELVASRKEKADARNIKIDEQIGATPVSASFDKERMGIALANILDNAIDYSPALGTVLVEVSTESGNGGNSNGARISISDHGIGIPEKEVERLFTKFYRAENAKRVRAGGTGLGLYLAKHIVEDHGGYIELKSRENAGSTFTILLPTATTGI